MKETSEKDINKIFAEGILIDQALNKAVREAVLQHKRAGNPVAVWRDGKTVWLKPEEITETTEILSDLRPSLTPPSGVQP